MQRRQAGHGQVEADAALEFAAAERWPVPGARGAGQQCLEPPPIEANGNNNGVIRDALAFLAVGDGHDHILLARLDCGRPPGKRAESARLVERRLGLQREHATIGALEKLAPVRLGQARPVGWVGVEAVSS